MSAVKQEVSTWEARAPKAIMERAASAMSVKGIDPHHIPSTSPDKIRPQDWALAVQLACEDDYAGYLCLRSRWLADPAAMAELAAELAKEVRGRVKDKHLHPLAALVVREYCTNAVSVRQICRALKVSRENTWPKLEGPFRRMLQRAYKAEANLGRRLREIMY